MSAALRPVPAAEAADPPAVLSARADAATKAAHRLRAQALGHLHDLEKATDLRHAAVAAVHLDYAEAALRRLREALDDLPR